MIHNEKFIKIAIWFVAFIFPLVVLSRGMLLIFINTGSLDIYWLLIPFLVSLGVFFKIKLARWMMLFGFYFLFFYELIGTDIGMTVCFSSSLDLVVLYSFLYALSIFILSTNISYKLFELDKSIRIHELITFGLMTFSIVYFDMINYWFLS